MTFMDNAILQASRTPTAGESAQYDRGDLVRFVDVEKTYDGSTIVVNRLNLAVRRGEFLTLLGPSGSGKTTCLMMLAGFEAPSGGDILLDGRSLKNVPPYSRGIGVVFQNYALFPHLTIAENVAYPLRQRKQSRVEIDRRVGDALGMIELAHLADRRPAQLSGGQQQRVAIARAFVNDPEIVLADEPTGNLDSKSGAAILELLRRTCDELSATIVMVTHDARAASYADRVIFLKDGAIVRELQNDPTAHNVEPIMDVMAGLEL